MGKDIDTLTPHRDSLSTKNVPKGINEVSIITITTTIMIKIIINSIIVTVEQVNSQMVGQRPEKK